MKIIYAKYNRERLPKYQIVTKIVVDKNKSKFAIKEPLNDDAKQHIDNILKNFNLLNSNYKLNLAKPIIIDSGLKFEIIDGNSLEKILLDSLYKNDILTFEKYLNRYLDLIDNMVYEKNIYFKPTRQFIDIFGEWKINEPQDIIKIANIDMIFGNIFVNHKDEFVLIDYEWVFSFEIPKSYIVWRALKYLSIYHNININKYLNSNLYDDFYLELDNNFSNYVFGYQNIHNIYKDVVFFNSKELKITKNSNSFIELFLDSKKLDKKSSYTSLVLQNNNLQKYTFNFKNYDEKNYLLIKLFNNSCIVELKNIFLEKYDGYKINLINHISSNAITHTNNIYYFDIENPQIYFKDISQDILRNSKSFTVEIKYLYFSNEALRMCIKKLNFDLLIKNFYNKQPNGKIIFFGASSALEKKFDKLKELGIIPDYICDNDKSKHGKYFREYEIKSPDEIFEKDEKFFVLITSSYVDEIKNQISEFKNVIVISNLWGLGLD